MAGNVTGYLVAGRPARHGQIQADETSRLFKVPFHVRITSRDPLRRSHDALALDKDSDWIEERIAAPRREGRDIFIDGQVFTWDSIDKILITETEETSEQLIPQIHAHRQGKRSVGWLSDRWYVASDGRDVTERFITGPPGTGPRADASKATTFAGNRKAVMVIYGHDKPANDALFSWLRAIGLQPREWTQLIRASGSASPFIGEVLDKALRDVQAVIAFFTPDEYVTAVGAGQGPGRRQARPNVLIEAGMALITHPTRTIIAVLGDQELPTDLAGRHYVRLSHTDVEPLNDLAGRLGDAGCDIDLSGSDWLHSSRFPDRDSAAPPADEGPASQTRQAGAAAGPASSEDPTHDGDAKDLASGPAASAESASEPHDASEETRSREAVQRARQDTEARQVLVAIEAKPGEHFTHLITVSTPITYAVKQVQAEIAWQANNGLGMTSPGFSGDPPHTDGQRRYYTFRASVNPQIRPEPAIRFVDLYGNRYYQFRDHTQRFPANTDWSQALTAIDEWLRTGPSA
jgi:predicted nucleotide-binding protein